MPNSLLSLCSAAHRDGADFPTIWKQILRKHPLVAGLPIQGIDDDGPSLRVLLVTGQHLVFREATFSLE